MTLMRAVVHHRYGGPEVLQVEQVERPTPKADEVVVKVVASTVNRTDCGFRLPRPFFVRFFSGLRRPKFPVLGTEFAGVVDAVGAAVTEFAVGDEVFGVNADHFGAHAEYLCVKEGSPMARKPAAISFEEAAAVCDGAILALSCLRDADLRRGRKVLVYGASGSIGIAGAQVARNAGAQVTAVCNGKNLDTVRSLGPDRVIDYEQEDFTESGETYDVIFDAVGKLSFRRCRGSLEPDGMYITTDLGFLWQNPFLALATAKVVKKKAKLPMPKYTKENVLRLAEMIETGRYRAVIDRCYPLDEVVEATKYVETHQKTGNVVLLVGQAGR